MKEQFKFYLSNIQYIKERNKRNFTNEKMNKIFLNIITK
jgi:hypothetical protein